jgi:hypothetical protein
MRYSTIVEKNDKTLLEIIDALEQFEEDRFIAGIQARHYSKFQLEQTLDMVRSYQSRMNIEVRALVQFSETYIQQFATDNNKCFNHAERYFNRIRSTLGGLKKVFQKTCPRSMVQLPNKDQKPSVFERSPLSYGVCVMDMYGIASYDDVVQELYHELETLLSTAVGVLGLCHQMIESEKMIRDDMDQLKTIYRESCRSLMSGLREYSELMGTCGQVPETDLSRRKASAGSLDDFLRKEYHNVAKKEFKLFVWQEAMRRGQSDGLTEEETFLWTDNHDKVKLVRWAIEHFDELDVEGQQGKLDSVSIVYFLRWCGVATRKEKRLYQYFCSNYCGCFQPLVWSAVSKERKEQMEHGISSEEATRKFQKMLDMLSEAVAV